jgi:hypothetical protein
VRAAARRTAGKMQRACQFSCFMRFQDSRLCPSPQAVRRLTRTRCGWHGICMQIASRNFFPACAG